MSLLNKIKNARIKAKTIRQYASIKNKDFVENYIFQNELEKIVNDDLKHKNPDTLFEQYKEYFETKTLPTKTINPDTIFYRGRIGNKVILGAEDDYSREFILPYNSQEIGAPPPIYAKGGRFNRQGISYLYLADTIETCLAEVHLQIGQNCSVGEFKCKEKIEVIDLTKFNNEEEIKNWLIILTQPVHNEIEYIYNITRFLADVFKSINNNGIYFKSVQAEGHNLVCFNPSLFQLVKYSEKIFTATKIKYDYKQFEDSIREYSKSGNNKYINSHNQDEDDKKQKQFEYLNNWIDHERTLNKGNCIMNSNI